MTTCQEPNKNYELQKKDLISKILGEIKHSDNIYPRHPQFFPILPTFCLF